MIRANRTVTVAIGHGKKAAHSIDAWLGGGAGSAAARHQLASPEKPEHLVLLRCRGTLRPQLRLARRITTFDKVTSGLDNTTALYEARKCPSCGNCFDVGPDNAVIELGSASGTRPSLTTAKAAASAPPSVAAKPSRYSPRRSELRFPSVASQTDQGHSTRDHQDQGPGSVAPATDIVK